MIKYLVAIIIFSFILISCRHSNQESIIKITDTENTQNRFCFINDIKEENKKAILIFDLIEHKKDSSSSQSKIIELPNGYNFSNAEKKFETIEIDSILVIIMQTFSFGEDGNFKFNQKVNLTDFMNVFTDLENSRFKMIPFRIVSTGTRIDSLFEIYIP